jgi:hypothetical protein
MTDTTKNETTTLGEQKQALRAQLFAITSQGRVLATTASAEEKPIIDGLLLDVHDLVEGVEDVAGSAMGTEDKARRDRAERRLAEDIIQRALSLGNRQCVVAAQPADDLHIMSVEEKARVQAAEKKLARNVCRLSQGLAVDADGGSDDEALRTMLISYAPNQGILNIAIDTSAIQAVCQCQAQTQTHSRQILTFAMQVQVICRMALDVLNAVA